MSRTYTDGLWTCEKLPSSYVLAMLGIAIDPDELGRAVTAALLSRLALPWSFGQQVVLQALHGFDDDQLVAAVPYSNGLLRDGLAGAGTDTAEGPDHAHHGGQPERHPIGCTPPRCPDLVQVPRAHVGAAVICRWFGQLCRGTPARSSAPHWS